MFKFKVKDHSINGKWIEICTIDDKKLFLGPFIGFLKEYNITWALFITLF